MSLNGETGTNTPITLAMLLTPTQAVRPESADQKQADSCQRIECQDMWFQHPDSHSHELVETNGNDGRYHRANSPYGIALINSNLFNLIVFMNGNSVWMQDKRTGNYTR